MSDAWQDLMKKVQHLRDLKDAITHVKKAGILNEKPEMKKDEKPVETPKAEAKPEEHMKLIGKKKSSNGSVQFTIGHMGHPEHYEINVDLHAKRKQMPAITVSHRKADGSLLSRSKNLHDDYASAIKSIVSHKNTKSW